MNRTLWAGPGPAATNGGQDAMCACNSHRSSVSPRSISMATSWLWQIYVVQARDGGANGHQGSVELGHDLGNSGRPALEPSANGDRVFFRGDGGQPRVDRQPSATTRSAAVSA